MQPGPARHPHLRAVGRRVVQPVVAEVARDARLVVPGEPRQAAADVGPLGEPVAPPGVVLGDAVELRQVERQHHGPGGGAGRQRLDRLEQRTRRGVAPHLARDVGVAHGPHRDHAGVVPVQAVVQQRVGLRPVLQVALPVERPVEPGRRRPPLVGAADQVVLERVHPGDHHIRRLAAVVDDIELRDGADGAAQAVQQEVLQAELARRHVVLGAVPVRVEVRDGLASLGLSVLDVVQQGFQIGVPHVAVAPQVPGRVEVGVGKPALAPAVSAVMGRGVYACLGDVAVVIEEPFRREQAGAAHRQKVAKIEPGRRRLTAASHDRFQEHQLYR